MKFLLLLALCSPVFRALPVNTTLNDISSKTSKVGSFCMPQVLQDKYLLAHILSQLGKLDHLTVVNKLCREVAVEMQIKMLVDITGYEPFLNMEAGNELNMLLAACERMKGRLSDIFVFASAFYPRSQLTVDFVVMIVMNDQSRTAEDKKSYFSWLAGCLVGDSNILALARLLEKVPDDLFQKDYYYSVSPRTYYDLAQVNQVMALKLLKLNPSSLSFNLLSSILLAEVPFDDLTSFFNPALSLNSLNYQNGTPFRAIIELCTSNFPSLPTNKRTRILQQNINLMDYWDVDIIEHYIESINLQSQMSRLEPQTIQKVSSDIDSDKSYALLLNRMRFAGLSDDELRVEIWAFLNSNNGPCKDTKTCGILLALMHMQKPALFKEILERTRPTPTQHLQKAILKHPDFANDDLSVGEYRQLMYSHSPLAVVRFEKAKKCSHQTLEETRKIDNVAMRLAVIAEVHPDSFKKEIEGIAKSGGHYQLLASIKLFLREFDQPALYIDIIGSHINVSHYKTRELLNDAETLSLLLSHKDGADFLFRAMQQVHIRPESAFFRALLEVPDLTNAALSDKCNMILRNLVVDIREIVKIRDMDWRKMSALFSILQIPINQSFSGTVNEETLTEFSNWLSTATVGGIADRAGEPEFLPHLACMIAEFDCKNLKFQTSIKNNRPNPLLLRFFFLYEQWFSTDRVHFEAYAPPLVKRVFPRCAEPSEERS